MEEGDAYLGSQIGIADGQSDEPGQHEQAIVGSLSGGCAGGSLLNVLQCNVAH